MKEWRMIILITVAVASMEEAIDHLRQWENVVTLSSRGGN
jgi:hypothetical protein